jgi:hypothetical protein
VHLQLKETNSSGQLAADQAKALAFFRWVNHAQESAPAERKPLLINLDETSLAYAFTGASGTVICAKHLPPEIVDATEDADMSDTHGHVTYVSMVTHETHLQPLLPQILIGNEHCFTKKLLAEVKPHVPANFVLLRKKSAWNCHETMRNILSHLAKALRDVIPKRHVILLLDVHRSHIHSSIFSLSRRYGIRLIYVPAKLTFLLQPLDTHVFAFFKRMLLDAWREEKASCEGAITKKRWLLMIFRCVRKVLQGTRWTHAFHATGALGHQAEVSPKVFFRMGCKVMPTVPAGPPTQQEVVAIFPRGSKINVMTYVMWCAAKDLKPLPASPELAATSSSSEPAATFDEATATCAPSSEAGTHSAFKPLKWVLRPRLPKGSASSSA